MHDVKTNTVVLKDFKLRIYQIYQIYQIDLQQIQIMMKLHQNKGMLLRSGAILYVAYLASSSSMSSPLSLLSPSFF